MIKYILKKNMNKTSSAYGKWYAYPVVEETMDLEALAKHMKEHNSGFSEAMCVGVMKAMVSCIKEQLLAGKNVKIDDLAIFSVGLRTKAAEAAADFNPGVNIQGCTLRCRATGQLRPATMRGEVQYKEYGEYVSGAGGIE